MSKHLKIGVLSLSFLIVLLVVLGGLGVLAASNNNDGAYRQLGVYSEVLSRIRTEYVEEPNFSAVTSGALHGLLDSLDANSSYLNPEEYKFYKSHQNDGRANIGATVSRRFGYAAVVSVLPGGPADKAGIQTGDIIEAIEGKSTHEMSLAAIEEELAGKQGKCPHCKQAVRVPAASDIMAGSATAAQATRARRRTSRSSPSSSPGTSTTPARTESSARPAPP